MSRYTERYYRKCAEKRQQESADNAACWILCIITAGIIVLFLR